MDDLSFEKKYRPTTFEEVIGNQDTILALKGAAKRKKGKIQCYLFQGDRGCVDADTEFLTPFGWKKICDYKKGDKVLQFDKLSGEASFVFPLKYIKNKNNQLNFFKTKYGVNQCLSDEHNVLYKSKKSKKWNEIKFKDLKEKHNKNKTGFRGVFKSTFIIDNKSEFLLSNEELRVQVMVNADCSLEDNRKKCCLNIKKKRKIRRAEVLLRDAGIKYEKYLMANGYVRFYFIPPIKNKEYSDKYYKCSFSQLKIIVSEVLFWDGNQKNMFYSISKKSADFIQYAFSGCEQRATILFDRREGRKTCYRVCVSKNKYVGISNGDGNKIKIENYKTKDGYEYCFTVPSSYLVLRREGRIFITGNCGKTTLARILAKLIGATGRDLKEFDLADVGGKDKGRDIKQKVQPVPMMSEAKVYIFDECQEATKGFEQTMLKVTEEPPPHAFFIFCTTDPQKMNSALRSRCSIFNIYPSTETEVYRKIASINIKEKIGFSKELLKEIAKRTGGIPREALILFDQVKDIEDEQTAMRIIKNFAATVEDKEVIALANLLINGDGQDWDDAMNILHDIKKPVETIRRGLYGYLAWKLRRDPDKRVRAIQVEFEDNTYDNGLSQLVGRCHDIMFAGEEE